MSVRCPKSIKITSLQDIPTVSGGAQGKVSHALWRVPKIWYSHYRRKIKAFPIGISTVVRMPHFWHTPSGMGYFAALHPKLSVYLATRSLLCFLDLVLTLPSLPTHCSRRKVHLKTPRFSKFWKFPVFTMGNPYNGFTMENQWLSMKIPLHIAYVNRPSSDTVTAGSF